MHMHFIFGPFNHMSMALILRRFLKIGLLMLTLQLFANDCFMEKFLPNFTRKDSSASTNDRWLAIEIDYISNLLFLAGYFENQADYWGTSSAAAGDKPVAACYVLSNNAFRWFKRFIDADGWHGHVEAMGLDKDRNNLIITGTTQNVADLRRFVYILDA